MPGRSPEAALGCRGLAATCPAMGRRESLGEFSRDRPPNTLAGLERILGPILADWRHTRATGHLAGRPSDGYTLNTPPEEMADGDPLMAEVFGALP